MVFDCLLVSIPLAAAVGVAVAIVAEGKMVLGQ
jgi:hypothetical protein